VSGRSVVWKKVAEMCVNVGKSLEPVQYQQICQAQLCTLIATTQNDVSDMKTCALIRGFSIAEFKNSLRNSMSV
jgi:hypothetical protein